MSNNYFTVLKLFKKYQINFCNDTTAGLVVWRYVTKNPLSRRYKRQDEYRHIVSRSTKSLWISPWITAVFIK